MKSALSVLSSLKQAALRFASTVIFWTVEPDRLQSHGKPYSAAIDVRRPCETSGRLAAAPDRLFRVRAQAKRPALATGRQSLSPDPFSGYPSIKLNRVVRDTQAALFRLQY